MKPRQAEVDLYYNGAAVKTVMDEYITGISYTDPASGAADSLDISIHDRARQWITAWMPISGDTLSAKISLSGDDAGGIPLDCGFSCLINSSSAAGQLQARYPRCPHLPTAALWPRCAPRIGRASP